MSNVRLTKAGLLEAIKDYPDDAPVVVATAADRNTAVYLYLTDNKYDNKPVAWSVSDDPNKIILEL